MDFDEIEYLEKTVEEAEDQQGSSAKKKKKKDGSDGKSERSYRKRDVDDSDDVLDKDDDRKSKRSRGDDENGSSRDRHRKDRDRERDRDRDSERDRDRERSSKERDRERSHRDKDRERERERERERRDRDRDRDRDKEREKERERRERRDKEREEERDRRERSSSRSRRYDSDKERDIDVRDSRTFREKKEAAEPEADPERDQRTVFVYQMPLKASERDVYEFFSKAGKVRDVRLIMDRNSRRSKGFGYIEFYDAMSVPMAIALSGQLLLGQPVMVKPSEAEKNLVQSNASSTAGSTAGPYGPVDRKLYVGNLHFNMTEMQLRQIFEPFGTVELVQMPLDLETGQCKGFGFVQFAQVESAKLAQSALNGKLEIAGRTIKVSSVTEHGGQQDTGAKSADFDDDDGGGLALNAQSRAMLMAKLDRTGIATSIAAGTLGVPVVNGSAPAQPIALSINGQAAIGSTVLPAQVLPSAAYEPIGTPSDCLLLKNMFDPASETEPDFDLDIKEDVEEECSKYGRVKHIFVDKNSAGFVYLRFDSVDSAARAQRAMHLRWFARRTISAIFMQPHDYEAKFGKVA